jgi:hypothetical protein
MSQQHNSRAFSLRLRIQELRDIIKITERQLEEAKEEIKSCCKHEHVIVLSEGRFASAYEVAKWAKTEIPVDDSPAVRICLVCGFNETGKKVIVSGQGFWNFEVLVDNPIKISSLKNPWHSIEEQEVQKMLSKPLEHRLETLITEMRKIGVEI